MTDSLHENFVIIFPRSHHGSFNFGLNHAKADNLAPGDRFLHGRFGAKLYQLYQKATLMKSCCVVVEVDDCDSKALPYLKKGLHKIYAKEKYYR